jgi:signal transduction histidine kinase
MLKGIERLSRLVDQLLELSQFESGAIRIDRQDFLVSEVIEDAAAEVRPFSTEVRIVAEVGNGLAGAGDPERIHEALTNLLTNAVRHSPGGRRGQGTGCARARRHPDRGQRRGLRCARR